MERKRREVLFRAPRGQAEKPKFRTAMIPELRKKYKPGQKIEILMAVSDEYCAGKVVVEFTVIEAYPYHVTVADRCGGRTSFQYVELEQACN